MKDEFLMKPQKKTADDILVSDASEGLRRLQDATRHILSIPKSNLPSHPRSKIRRRKK
jgi:hypothetical protein